MHTLLINRLKMAQKSTGNARINFAVVEVILLVT